MLLYGATGFTGRQAAHYLAEKATAFGFSLAIAGRNREKLEQLRQSLPCDVDLVVADGRDAEALDAMVARASVVASTAGPFARFGDFVVAACVRYGTHYVDITGELLWVRRLIDRLHDQAARNGTRIIPLCGFDSVPADIGTLMVVQHIRDRLGYDTSAVRAFYRVRGGGLNGGTLASALDTLSSKHVHLLADPVLLNPRDHQTDEERRRSPDQSGPIFDEKMGRWTAPFLMAPINTRVVRRSNALHRVLEGKPYGEEFTYHESLLMGRRWGRARAEAVAWMGARFEGLLRSPRGRSLLRRVGPKPGQGPSEEKMDSGSLHCVLVGTSSDGRQARGVIKGSGDLGNRITVKALCESALCLALQRNDLPGGPQRGGILTPATGLGTVLIHRLRAAGITLEMTDS